MNSTSYIPSVVHNMRNENAKKKIKNSVNCFKISRYIKKKFFCKSENKNSNNNYLFILVTYIDMIKFVFVILLI